jgi:predicted anti-sigma-YlaC factor YlaD
MLIPVPPSECTRAREAVSGRLDGELSELDAVRLDVHLGRCPACREFAAQAAAFTEELRRAPLEPLAAPVFEPRRPRRRAPALRVQAAAAAAVAVVAGGSLMLGRMVGSGAAGPKFTSSAPASGVAGVRQDSIDQRLFALLPGVNPQRSVIRNGPIVPL